jgi:hypothetical protein
MESLHKIYFGLFVLFLALYLVNPSSIQNMYKTLLGRIILISIVIFFSMNNLPLGLLVGLIIIISSSTCYYEGFENNDVIDPSGVKIDAPTPVVPPSSLKPKEDILSQTNIPNGGVDIQAIKDAVQSKPSNSLPLPSSQTSSTNVAPSAKETFTSMYGAF